jgi:D-lyxose ketol-isomerase
MVVKRINAKTTMIMAELRSMHCVRDEMRTLLQAHSSIGMVPNAWHFFANADHFGLLVLTDSWVLSDPHDPISESGVQTSSDMDKRKLLLIIQNSRQARNDTAARCRSTRRMAS